MSKLTPVEAAARIRGHVSTIHMLDNPHEAELHYSAIERLLTLIEHSPGAGEDTQQKIQTLQNELDERIGMLVKLRQHLGAPLFMEILYGPMEGQEG